MAYTLIADNLTTKTQKHDEKITPIQRSFEGALPPPQADKPLKWEEFRAARTGWRKIYPTPPPLGKGRRGGGAESFRMSRTNLASKFLSPLRRGSERGLLLKAYTVTESESEKHQQVG